MSANRRYRGTLPPTACCRFFVEYTQTIPEHSYQDGLTLLLFHAVNLHKEILDVMVQNLIRLCSTRRPTLRIRDIWTVDNPNHGRSAVLNDEILSRPEEKRKNTWTAQEHTNAAMSLLCSQSIGVDFRSRKLVGVAHCGGATSLVLIQKMKPSFPFHGAIFLDPSIFDWRNPTTDALASLFRQFALRKRDTWPNRKAAYEYLSQRSARKWHPEVLNSFVEHGLRTIGDSDVVTLACTREQEALYFSNWTPTVITISDVLVQIAQEGRLPLYLIIAEEDEYAESLRSKEMKEFQSRIIKMSRLGSVQTVPRGGHLFPLTEPAMAAESLWDALLSIQESITRPPPSLFQEQEHVVRARL